METVTYYTILIPPGNATEWHSPIHELYRGAFDTAGEAREWARKYIPGCAYTLAKVTYNAIGDTRSVRGDGCHPGEHSRTDRTPPLRTARRRCGQSGAHPTPGTAAMTDKPPRAVTLDSTTKTNLGILAVLLTSAVTLTLYLATLNSKIDLAIAAIQDLKSSMHQWKTAVERNTQQLGVSDRSIGILKVLVETNSERLKRVEDALKK